MNPKFAVLAVTGCLLATWVLAQDESAPPAEKPANVLRHVVLLKFKPEATAEKIREIETEFAKLPQAIDQITDFEWGTDVSTEGLGQGFTHCFLVTFDSEEGRDAYLPHPAHEQFVQLLRPHLEEALVIDYKPQPAAE